MALLFILWDTKNLVAGTTPVGGFFICQLDWVGDSFFICQGQWVGFAFVNCSGWSLQLLTAVGGFF